MTYPVRILMCALVVGGSLRGLAACAPPDYTAGATIAETCVDAERNGDETDTDCGGGECPPCVVGQKCRTSLDCDALPCTGGVCRSPHCANGRVDQDETGVDCGGQECPKCTDLPCENGVLNDGETDLDCGGDCSPCDLGKNCLVAKDCASGYCGDSNTCEDPHCLNGKKDSTETDEDCGGPDCEPCAEGQACVLPRDCVDLACKDDECQPPSCDDDVQNGDETDTDCGGDCEEGCPDGGGCNSKSDCQSKVCSDNVCQEPTCNDGVQNGDETGTDCGGALCQAVRTCSADQPCLDHSDCATGWCDPDDKICTEPSCEDGFANGDETDIDCGGPDCAGCEAGYRCSGSEDCESVNCIESVCLPATCKDGIQNQGEAGTDCGGSSPCEKCADGRPCRDDSACASGVCDWHGLCAAPTCDDGTHNGLETDVDCGGGECPPCGALQKCLDATTDCEQDYECPPESGVCVKPECANGTTDEGETDQDCGGTCPPCADGMTCLAAKDCQSRVCDEDTGKCLPPTCEDGIKNGDESYEDCGGSDPGCARCDIGQPCNTGSDCVSSSCGQEQGSAAKTCLEPTCDDGVKNGDEIGKDCRGSCPDKCPANEPCTGNADCVSGVCTNKICQAPRCDDETKNGSETDVDCGGNCDPCDDLLKCTEPSDCQSQVCTGSTCQVPTCEDGVTNDGETGKDCGGDCLPLLCPNGEGCSTGDDCQTGVCRYSVCVPPDCEDGVKKGEETDIDCGGSKCSACGIGKGCLLGRDCVTLSCSADNVCLKATCDDRIKNQGETDTDCGGGNCDGCDTGKICLTSSDCLSAVCRVGATGLVCQAPTCSDQTKNQGEGDVDCGGGVCSRCAAGKTCGSGSDCRSGLCSSNKCQPGEVEVYFFGTVESVQDYRVNLQVKNIGSSNIDLSNYTFRYYLSDENGVGLGAYDCQGCNNVTFTQDSGSQWHAVVTLGSTPLTPGSTSSIRFRLHSNGVNMDWVNDYSYGPQSTYTSEPWLTTPAYRGSTPVFGIPRP